MHCHSNFHWRTCEKDAWKSLTHNVLILFTANQFIRDHCQLVAHSQFKSQHPTYPAFQLPVGSLLIELLQNANYVLHLIKL